MSKKISQKILGWLLIILTADGIIFGLFGMEGLFMVSIIVLIFSIIFAVICWVGLISWLISDASE